MQALYIVRTTFRAHGVLHEVGTVIDDPSSIRLFRSRLGVGDIIELSPNDRKNDMWLSYLESRSRKPLDPKIYQVCGKTLPDEHPAKVVTTTAAAKPAVKTAVTKSTATKTTK